MEIDCPDLEAADVALLTQWHSLQSGFRRLNERLLRDIEAASGLAPSSFEVLWVLLAAPEHTAPMNHLSQALGFSTAGTTKVVDRLVEAALVERRPAPQDRRVTLAVLTDAGYRTATEATRVLADGLRRHAVGPLGDEGFAVLSTGLGLVASPTAPAP